MILWSFRARAVGALHTPHDVAPCSLHNFLFVLCAQPDKVARQCRLRLMKNIVYFDLETQKSAEEVGGWDKIGQMGMSVGVTYSTARGGYAIYGENHVNELLRELQRA